LNTIKGKKEKAENGLRRPPPSLNGVLCYSQVQMSGSTQQEPSSAQTLPRVFAETLKTIVAAKIRAAIPAISHLYFFMLKPV
jgi:hypothetical protein